MRLRVPSGFSPPAILETFEAEGEDGIRRRGHLLLPSGTRGPSPVLLSPHPFGFDPLINLFGHGGGQRTLVPLPGVWDAAERYGFAVLTVQSEGRRFTGASLGWRPHLDAFDAMLAQAVERRLPIREDRIVAAGLSMGGMEALLLGALLGSRVSAVAVQNAVVDLPDWLQHMDGVEGFEHVVDAIRGEVGDRSPAEEMRERSPSAHLDGLRDTPVQVRYSEYDDLVPAATQSLRLSGRSSRWSLVEDSPTPIDGVERGRHAHEHVRWDELLGFLAAALDERFGDA